MKKFLVALCAIASFGLAGMSKAAVITFSEVILPTLTLLDGTTHYDPYGIRFFDTTFYALDARFLEDGRGITTTGGPDDRMTVRFQGGAAEVSFSWLTINSSDIHARAFDQNGNLVDSFDQTGNSGVTYGIASLSGNISHISWQDGNGQIGIDSLNVTPIPEPEIYAMLAAGLGLMGFVARRRKQQLAAA